MTRQLSLTLLAALTALVAATPAQAQIIEVFNEAEVAGGIVDSFLGAVTVSGGTAYAVSRDTSSDDTGAVVSFDGVTFTTVMTPAQWTAFGSTNDIAAGNGVGVVGGSLRSVSFFDNNVYEVDLGTGTVTEAVSAAAINAATGVTSNLSVAFEVGSDGTIYSFDFESDSIVAVSPANAVSVEVSAGDLGATSVGGVGIDGDTLLIGDNSNDELVAWDTVGNAKSTVLDTATIEAVTDDVDGRVGFGDILAAPNGLIYFYESDSDYLLSYDPADPAGTLAAVITEAEFGAGPSSDLLGQLAWWDGRIAYTDQSDGFYTLIPEPTSAALGLLALAGFGVARRR